MRSGTHRDLYAGQQVAVLHTKTRDEGWDPYRLVILMLITLFCMHKAAGDVRPIHICNSAPKGAVLNVKTSDECWDP